MKEAMTARDGALPATTLAAQYRGSGEVDLVEAALPPPGAGEITVRVTACGICASEVLRWYADAKAPFMLGHEPVGEVVAVGADAAFAVGERVFVHHHTPCMRCARCRRGDYVQCERWRPLTLRPGGMAQFTTVAADAVRHDVLRLPDQLSDDSATLIEPLATVIKSVRRSGLRRGDSVLIIGAGAMGILHLLVARRYGASTVSMADRSDARLARARALGADQTIHVGAAADAAATPPAVAQIVFVTPGSLAALEQAAQCVGPGGNIVVFTPPPPDERWPLDINRLFFADISVITSYSAGPDDTRAALELLASGVEVEPLFSHRYPLAQVADAYAAMKDIDTTLKVVVHPNA